MAHHPRMIRMLEETVPGAEAEVARLESEGGGEIIRIEVKDGPPRA